MKKIKYYFRLVLGYLKIGFFTLLQYRSDFFIGIIAMIFLQAIGVLSIRVIMLRVPSINGWEYDQILFIYALAMLVRSIWHTFFLGILTLTWYVHDGTLDLLLSRPLSILFQLCNDELDDDGWGETILGTVLLIIAWRRLGIPFSWANLLFLLLTLICGTLIYNGITLIGSTLSFWTIRNGPFMGLIFDLTEFTKYPLNIYPKAIQVLFTFLLPIGFISFYPAQYFLQNQAYLNYVYALPLAAGIISLFAFSFWKTGIRHYQSTGS